MPQTTAVLRQALAEGCRIVLVLNKMDKLLPDALGWKRYGRGDFRHVVGEKLWGEKARCSPKPTHTTPRAYNTKSAYDTKSVQH